MTPLRTWIWIAVPLLALACDSTEPRPQRPVPVLDQPQRAPTMPQKPNPVPKAVMNRILDDVAQASGIARDEIVLERAEEATWGDTSLGCPQPNMGYMQRIVSGFWVVLHAGQQEYDYRVDHNLRHHRCTGATRQAPIKYPSDT
ncbi:MAG: hypothetical protein AB8G16_09560 [Gammaproteobacteria bacterium]